MKIMRKIIEIDRDLCNGCGACIVSCAEGALEIVDGKARLVGERYCDGLGACLGECPTGALKVIEREAEDFDEEAVERLLAGREKDLTPVGDTLPCGCPSTQLRTFESAATACQMANRAEVHEAADSALTHWPVQIRLVPANAPFLKNADLLVTADCAALASPSIHKDFLPGRVVLMGCPKFDDIPLYLEKFTEIFRRADIKSVTVLIMEVPCCGGLPMMVRTAMEKAGKTIPLETVVVGIRGNVLQRKAMSA
jgi:ferredoxin